MKEKIKYLPIGTYAERYMKYLGVAKTARRSYAESKRILEKAGFREISSFKTLKPGDRVYRGCEDRTILAAVIGRKSVAEAGIKVVGGHTDAPRLDLKPRPLYEKGGCVFFDCHIYGGIKKYQWLVLPLALYGTVVRKDGSKVDISVGDNEGDPVFMITDILPHLGKDQAKKTRDEFFEAEDLDPVCWTTYAEKEGKGEEARSADRKGLVNFLKKKYKITEEDLLSAELEIVPAGMPREVGFDRALITGYGHDDRVCSFAALEALVESADSIRDVTTSMLMCDKEEVGSMGSTGMQSSFFENTVAEIIERQEKQPRDIHVRRALEKSTMLSADVTAAADPHFPSVDSTGNEARLHKGVAASKYTGSTSKGGASDCCPEFVAEIRRIMEKEGVAWQMAELGRQEKGGGGTISQYMARFGMKVLDMGTPMWNMHAPWEIVSKFDAWSTYRAYLAYFRD
ncbi:MAG: aminopeptidase [Kiritimatiellae bacterium]|jgi:aspartyl aminopeptidase|nr:aminopeptidase [Kiritimatiellia bacterium]